jgi:uncharacterized membrane protein
MNSRISETQPTSQFTISGVFQDAWARTKGAKGKLWLALAAYIGFYIVISILVGLFLPSEEYVIENKIWWVFAVEQVIFTAVTMPVTAGLYMLGIRRAAGLGMPVLSIFRYFNKIIPLFITALLQLILVLVGFLLLVIPGIYLTIAYFFAIPLVVEKDLSPWAALETSRKAITKCWFRTFGFVLVSALAILVGMIPLGIGLIWTLPLAMIAYGVLYRVLFGCERLMATENPGSDLTAGEGPG